MILTGSWWQHEIMDTKPLTPNLQQSALDEQNLTHTATHTATQTASISVRPGSFDT